MSAIFINSQFFITLVDSEKLNFKPPDKSAYWKIIFSYFSAKIYVVGTQKNRLKETVLLSIQNACLD